MSWPDDSKSLLFILNFFSYQTFTWESWHCYWVLCLLQVQITNNISSSFGQNYLLIPAIGYPDSYWLILLPLRCNEVSGFILCRHSISCMFLKHLSTVFLICIILAFCFRYLWNKRSASDEGSPIVVSAPQSAAGKACPDVAVKVTCILE